MLYFEYCLVSSNRPYHDVAFFWPDGSWLTELDPSECLTSLSFWLGIEAEET